MALWKDGAFIADRWRIAAGDDDPIGPGTIVSLARWRAAPDRPTELGLLIAPGEDWSDIRERLARIPVIAVSIPKYADGRAFSIARLLRQRDFYRGEIRAVGHYIIDQMPFMRRVGIDAFQTDDPVLIGALEAGRWPEVPAYLQPVDDSAEVPAGTRPWARRATAAGGKESA